MQHKLGYLILLVCVSSVFQSLCQNLVPNPSFEQAVIRPEYDLKKFEKTSVSCWVQATSLSFSYLNDPVFGTGNLAWTVGNDLPARTGVAKAGIHQTIGNPYDLFDSLNDGRSYIQTKLIAPLAAGQSYAFKMYVVAAYFAGNSDLLGPITSLKNLGAHFSAMRPTNFTTNKRLNVTPQLTFNGIEFYAIPRAWVEVSGIYTAMGGERYLTIGNFDYHANFEFQNGSPASLTPIATYGGNQVQAYITIDDVSLIPLGSQDTSPISLNIGSDTTVCGDINLTLTASPGFDYYLWSDGSHAQTLQVTAPGTYWCRTDEYCTFCSDTIVITQLPTKTLELGNDTLFCENGSFSIPLNAGPGFSGYLWSTGATSAAIQASASGIYWVRVSYACGTLTDTIRISAVPKPSPPTVFDTSICIHADNVSLHAAGEQLLWYDSIKDMQGNPNAPDIQTNEEGIFHYFVSQTAGGCESGKSRISITIVSKPFFEFEDSITICEWEDIFIGPDENWTCAWNDGIDYSPRTIDQAGIYILNAQNQCGDYSDEVNLKIEECDCFFYLPNAFTPNNDVLNGEYQPVFDCFFERYELKIYNRWGEVIFHTGKPEQAWDGTYKGAAVPDGIYMVYIVYKSMKEKEEKSIKGHVILVR